MATIEEIISKVEHLAPLETQENWDNSGWQTYLRKKEIKNVMLCVTITADVLKQATAHNCDMIIAHHPLYFEGEQNKELVREIVRQHMPVYSIHTPFDKAKGGTTDMMIEKCGFCVDEKLNEYTKIYYADMPLKELIHKIKKGLGIENIRITNYDPKKIVEKASFCAGSGASFCDEVLAAGCDCFVTADVKYHQAEDFNGVLIDVGHLESEKPALETLKTMLSEIVNCKIAQEKTPITII